jgi:hypothetical protein
VLGARCPRAPRSIARRARAALDDIDDGGDINLGERQFPPIGLLTLVDGQNPVITGRSP